MLGQILAIARNTFLESVRQPIFVVLVLASGLLQALNTLLSAYSMGFTDTSEVSGDNKLLLDIGLATVFVVATLLAAFLATAVISREIENKTALTVISKPVGRPLFVIGKYLGATAAVMLALVVMLAFFMLAIRHGVMTTARDRVDMPVMTFTLGAIALAVGVGVWGNYFYGWVFSSTAMFLLAPAIVAGWALTLFIGKGWQAQSPMTDIKPQIMITMACVGLAMPVLTAVAVAASTRLGQVMTIVVCAGVFVMGLLSNHILGRQAFSNEPIAEIESAEVVRDEDGDFRDAGDVWRLSFVTPPSKALDPGSVFYYGASPNGLLLAVPPHQPFEGDVADDRRIRQPVRPGLVVTAAGDEDWTSVDVANAGGLPVSRAPRAGDWVFVRPTTSSPLAMAAWGVVPNLQFFWLVDAVTQTHPIPPKYVALTAAYSGAQVLALLSLAVILFQRREVG